MNTGTLRLVSETWCSLKIQRAGRHEISRHEITCRVRRRSDRDCGGSFNARVLTAVGKRTDAAIDSETSFEGVDTAYLAGLLRQVGLAASARKVLDSAIHQTDDALECSRLQNLQGRLAFETRHYTSAVSSFEEAFITAARVEQELVDPL